MTCFPPDFLTFFNFTVMLLSRHLTDRVRGTGVTGEESVTSPLCTFTLQDPHARTPVCYSPSAALLRSWTRSRSYEARTFYVLIWREWSRAANRCRRGDEHVQRQRRQWGWKVSLFLWKLVWQNVQPENSNFSRLWVSVGPGAAAAAAAQQSHGVTHW